MSRKGFWFGLLLVAGMLGGVSPDSNAQTIWKGTGAAGGNGTWATAGEWSAGVPTTLVDARFQVDTTYTSPTAAIAVTGAQATKLLVVGLGKSATLQFANGASLNAAGISTIGSNSTGTGTGAASLTFEGPGTGSATVSMIRFDVLRSSAMTFTGSLLTASSNGDSSIGRSATAGDGNSTMSVLNGAHLSLLSLAIGRGTSNNTVLVSGAGSVMSMSTTMGVGSSDANSAANALQVQSGGNVTITGLATAGQGTGGHSNYYEATGANSTITFTGGIRVGDQAATPLNNGGNYLRFASGGTGKFAAALDINSYDSSGTNYGSNYVKVDAGGTLTSSNTINVKNNGLLQLAATGAIEGRTPAGGASTATIAVASGGRFEAAGTGLGDANTVLTTVSSGGSFAVGLGGRASASILTLSNTASKLTLNTGSTLEIGLFGATSSDQLNFTTTNILTVGTGVNFKLTLQGYVPVTGNSWTIFTGSNGFSTGSAANLAAATFVEPSLSVGLSWDTTKFNQANGWVVSVAGVPEPSTVILFGLSLSALWIARRRKA